MQARTQRDLRRYHHYLGLFFAPAIFFFALSGALQTFRLQEEKGWGGTPPNWIVWLAAVHKDSGPPRERAAKPARAEPAMERPAAAQTPPPQPRGAARPSRLPMKIFAVLMSLGLMLSTALGVVIALNNRSMRRASLMLLAAGTVVPIALIYL